MRRFLITGGCGFIGSHLANYLIDAGHYVRVLDNLSTGKKENVLPATDIIVGDICEEDTLASAMKDMDGCFHLAAVASVKLAEEQWLYAHRTNQVGMLTVLKTINKKAKREKKKSIPLVFASSSAVYGPSSDVALCEKTVPQPANFYGIDKFSAELQAKAAFHNYGLASIGLRFFNIYGPRQNTNSLYSGVISAFIGAIMEDKAVTISGDGTQSRDFVYIDDVVKSLIAAMDHVGGGHQIFNICTGIATNIAAIADKLEMIHGRPIVRRYAPLPVGDVHSSLGNPDLFKSTVQNIDSTPFDQGLLFTYASLKTPVAP